MYNCKICQKWPEYKRCTSCGMTGSEIAQKRREERDQKTG